MTCAQNHIRLHDAMFDFFFQYITFSIKIKPTQITSDSNRPHPILSLYITRYNIFQKQCNSQWVDVFCLFFGQSSFDQFMNLISENFRIGEMNVKLRHLQTRKHTYSVISIMRPNVSYSSIEKIAYCDMMCHYGDHKSSNVIHYQIIVTLS